MGNLNILFLFCLCGLVCAQGDTDNKNSTGDASTSSTTTPKDVNNSSSSTILTAVSQSVTAVQSTTPPSTESTVTGSDSDSDDTPDLLTPTFPSRQTTAIMTTTTLPPYNCSMCDCYFQPEPNCVGQNLSQIPNTLGDIRKLYVYNNSIRVIYNNSLPYSDLVYLLLSHNHISRIESGAFAHMQKLDHLDLSYNLITQHSFDTNPVFSQMIKLRHLMLQGNMITVLKRKIFDWEQLTSLERLDLSYNRIIDCQGNALTNFFHLKNLNLSHNRIKRIDPDSLENNKALQILDLSYNRLTSLQGIFGTLPALTTLYLNSNKINKLDKNVFSNLKKLTFLSLSRNELTNHQDMFPAMVFYKLPIQNLNLSYNNFTDIPDALGGTGVISLDLSGNPLKQLHRDSFQVKVQTHLRSFTLNYCPNLEWVTLEPFWNFTALENISIAYNPKLTRIVAQEEEEVHPATLRHVSLRGNALESVSEFLLPWEQLESADLRNNPLRCDCNLRWMLRVKVVEPHNASLICASPPHLAGDLILAVKWDDFACFHELWATVRQRQITIGVVSAIIVMLTAVGAIIMYRNKWKLPGLYKKVGKYANMEDRRRAESTSCAEPGDPKVSYRDEDETACIDLGNADIEDLQDDTETLQETEQRTLRLSSIDRDDNEL